MTTCHGIELLVQGEVSVVYFFVLFQFSFDQDLARISLLASLWWRNDPRVRHNGTTVDTTPGPREGKVVGGVVPLWELAIRADVVVASTC